MKMKFRGHESFFIRKGWLTKGLKYITLDPYAFMGANENPMDIFGMGLNMTKSLRYWMQATNLTYEPRERRKRQKLTDFGKVIYENDPYIEEFGTLILLHYNLLKNKEMATSWYFFFNYFNISNFSKEDFIQGLNKFIKLNNGKKISPKSLEDDYDCLLKTYIPLHERNPKKVHPENIIDSPLGELGIIKIIDSSNKIYSKNMINIDYLDENIILSLITDKFKNQNEIKIIDLLEQNNSIGKVLNLDMSGLSYLLRKIELSGHIKVIRTSGLDVIRIEENINSMDYIKKYYKKIRRHKNDFEK